MAGRTYRTDAVVLRSLRLGEADRVLHLYTLERGRIGAVAKGIRRTKSRFGARLEPLSHVEVMLHQGASDLQTVTGAQLRRSHLEVLDGLPDRAPARPALDPLALSFQLKLLWLSGYLPHLTSCANCGRADELVGYSPRAGGAVCHPCSEGAIALSPAGRAGIETLLSSPLADAGAAELTDRAAREALAVVTASYEFHGGFRLRTLRSA